MLRKALLVLFLAVLACLLCACGGQQTEPDATGTPVPSGTETTYAADKLTLMEGIEKTTRDAQTLKDQLIKALPETYNIEVPFQNAESLSRVVADNRLPELADGEYIYSLSSGGNFIYSRPYAGVTYGANTDTYVVSGEGEPYETVENVKYDPLSFVLSGQGGGEFAYASYYVFSGDGARGEHETVSRLNDAVTGYSHYEYAYREGTLFFLDVQLSLQNDQTEGPYAWAALLGAVSKDGADMLEFTVTTAGIEFPAGLPEIYASGTADIAACAAQYGDAVSARLTAGDGRVQYAAKGQITEGTYH